MTGRLGQSQASERGGEAGAVYRYALAVAGDAAAAAEHRRPAQRAGSRG